MKFDGLDHSWKPAHEPELRLRSARPLILALSLLAFAAVTVGPRAARHESRGARATSAVAAAMLP
jgi:lipopolysaccharide export LptBFGC system permease protein LptF